MIAKEAVLAWLAGSVVVFVRRSRRPPKRKTTGDVVVGVVEYLVVGTAIVLWWH